MVQWDDVLDGKKSQLVAFYSQADAEACIARLEEDGWKDLYINFVGVHRRLADWECDR